MEEKINKEPTIIKTLFSFLLALGFITFGYILSLEYPNISKALFVLGFAGFLITAFYLVVTLTTWSYKIQEKVKEYFLLWFEIAYTLLVISVIALTIRFFVVQPFLIKGESMEPNLQNNNYIIINEISYKLGFSPQRGDIIVFKFPRDPRENYIKRVIGLPGEKIQIKDKKIYTNGRELKENYIPYLNQVSEEGDQEWNIGKDEYFVVGDNRLPGGSSDSRSWGLLPRKDIIGKAWFVFWPPQDIKIIPHPQYNS